MPITFEGVSEYRRNFVIPQTISDHSPPSPPPPPVPGPGPVRGSPGPHPQQQGHVISAGLSSAKMAVTHEPAFARKRKPVDHGKKVTFTTDYTENGSLTKEDNLAMKFRAGFRRVDVPTPTEYNLQYTWKSPADPDHTPILQAENLLNSQTGSPNFATNQRHLAQNGHHHVSGDFTEGDEGFEQLELHDEDPLHSNAVDGIADSSQLSGPGQKAPPIKVPKLRLAATDDGYSGKKLKGAHCSTSKASKKKPKSHHHHHHRHHHASHHQHASKKHHKGGGGGGGWHSKAFVSEYKRQFKAWPVSSTSNTSGTKGVSHSGKKKEKSKEVAGSPQVLTDSSDPRLLKHKPLPTHMPIARWGSEYSANFMSPSDFVYERGVWKGAPHPELFMKVEGSPPPAPQPPVAAVHVGVGHPSPSSQSQQPPPPNLTDSVSWFDQLVELRQRADQYRTRAQRVHFPPYHLSTHHHDNPDQDSSSITASSMTSSPPSEDHTPTEVSSPASDSTGGARVHIHVPQDFDAQGQQRSLSQNQGRLGIGRPQDQGKETHHSPQLFTKTTAPMGKRVGVQGVQIGDRGHGRMMVEDVEESWDSETLTDDGSSLQDGAKFLRSSTPPPHDSNAHVHVKTLGAGDGGDGGDGGDAEHSKFQERDCEPSVEIEKPKIIPRPNTFSLGGGGGEIEGRVPTPELRKSIPGQQSRHHLDTTTPSGGGLLISPTKPEVGGDRGVARPVQLPYPPVSPKYRRDMKSKAPIYPPPPREVGNGRQRGDIPVVSSTITDAPPQSVSANLGLRNVPTSPYHTHSVPRPPTIPQSKPTHNLTHPPPAHPHTHKSQAHKTAAISIHVPQPKMATIKPQTSYSSPVRKLLFESHSKQPPPSSKFHTQHTTKKVTSSLSSSQYKSHVKTSALSAAKSSHSNVKSCETCGSYLRSPAVLGGGVGALGAGHSGRVAPPTNLSQMHSDRASALQASRHQSQLKVGEIRSKLASHSIDPRGAPTNFDDYRQPQPDSGLGSSNRGRAGGQRSNGLGASVRRGREVDELSLSSLSLSSCSVASDVLQKARERKERFWTQPTHITAS